MCKTRCIRPIKRDFFSLFTEMLLIVFKYVKTSILPTVTLFHVLLYPFNHILDSIPLHGTKLLKSSILYIIITQDVSNTFLCPHALFANQNFVPSFIKAENS